MVLFIGTCLLPGLNKIWELESLLVFMDLLYSIPVRGDEVDKICWRPEKEAQFSVGSYFHSIPGFVEVSFPWKIIWKSHVPSCVAIFCLDCGVGENLDC
jgi:hypothetical protein